MRCQLLLAVALLPASTLFAQATPEEGVSLTVYSSADPAGFDPQQYLRMAQQNAYYGQNQPMPGYGVVREIRKLELNAGVNELRFTDVAAGIDPTTVSFLSLTDAEGTGVLEQSFEYDLVNSQKLLQKYVDKEVIVERVIGDDVETINGTLLNATGGLILQTDDGVRVINQYTSITLADRAELITKPTLVWNVESAQGGEQLGLVTYQTDGLTWRADYTFVLNADDTAVDVSSWVTLLNQSGATYKDASLKLVAGDVQRVKPRQLGLEAVDYTLGFNNEMRAGQAGFVEKSFFEYHLYTLGRKTTIPNNSTKQIELIPQKIDVPINKVFVYYGAPLPYGWSWRSSQPFMDRDLGIEMNKKVDTYLEFKNDEEHGMGVPLPAGRIRVYKVDDADNSREFVGEDVIQHTPKNEEVRVKVGSAFDIVGERRQTDLKVNTDGHEIIESFEIKLRNHKKESATILVKENLYRWSNWEITASSDKWEKQDFRTIHIPVTLKPDEERVVTYTVKYTW